MIIYCCCRRCCITVGSGNKTMETLEIEYKRSRERGSSSMVSRRRRKKRTMAYGQERSAAVWLHLVRRPVASENNN
jgi:hypothetical protein